MLESLRTSSDGAQTHHAPVCVAVGPMSQAVEPMYGWDDGVIATM
eukprot:COSAG02_NODE_8023_length_2743_cov_1.909228_3_plen_45_part_00